jgi:CBS domain containing-hemolysin-like protein
MTLLIVYILIALVISFLCSIAEAVLLSVSPAYIALLEKDERPAGKLLHELKTDVQKPLAAILTLNTIAHTIGAAGAGAQVIVVFGNAYLGIASVILTLLILFLSEIIPKTLGAVHWRSLAPATAFGLRYLIILLYPFVKLSEYTTRRLSRKQSRQSLSRQEFAALAELGMQEGQLAKWESSVFKNLLNLREMRLKDAMTPRPVVFSVPQDMTVSEFVHEHRQVKFSRIPVYRSDPDHIEGFVLRSDILMARARGQTQEKLTAFLRPMPVMPKALTLAQAFDVVHPRGAHMAQVVDEYGNLLGILTLEDIIETVLGVEIVDEGDAAIDMQELARELWNIRLHRFRQFEEDD